MKTAVFLLAIASFALLFHASLQEAEVVHNVELVGDHALDKAAAALPLNESSVVNDCTPGSGEWSDWVQCDQPCGMCGHQSQQRFCTTVASGCTCSGPTNRAVRCPSNPCPFPHEPCCAPFKERLVAGHVVCAR